MEVTVVKIGTSLGVEIPETMINNYKLKAGAKIEMSFIQDGRLILRKKSKIREDWDSQFVQYALNGEDKPLLPDFLDSETDAFL